MPYAPRRYYRRRKPRAARVYKSKAVVTRRPRPPYRKRRLRLPPLAGAGYSKLIRMRYCTTFTIDPAAGTIPVHHFNLWNLHDPDNTGSGHQPMGYDAWQTFFSHYTVLGGKINLKVDNSDAGQRAQIVTRFSEVATAPAVGADGTFSKSVESGWRNRLVGALYGKSHSWNYYFSAKKIFHLKNTADVLRNYPPIGADFENAPSQTGVFSVGACSSDQGDMDPITFHITIDYLVMLTDRITTLTQS